MSEKRALRARFRAARDEFHARVPVMPPSVAEQFVDRLRPGLVIASYVPVGSETPPTLFEDAAEKRACRMALPFVVDRGTPLRFIGWRRVEALGAGPFGLSNPHPSRGELRPDVILTPLLAFDRRGNRLGQGAGHYDRAFACYPQAWRVGIAWSIQEADALSPDPWDVPLHAIATEKEWITP